MTQNERLIVSAYTGILMCDMSDLHKYIEDVMGRPVFTHELGYKEFTEKLKDKVRDDFIALCEV